MIAPEVKNDRQEAPSAAARSREEAVAAAAEAQLRHSAYIGLRDVRCRYHRGRLTLQGRVSRYYLKQVAQSLVGRLTEVVDIDNRLDVASSADWPVAEGRWPEASDLTYWPR